MPVFLLLALFLAFGVDSLAAPAPVGAGEATGWVAGLVLGVGLLAGGTSLGVAARLRRDVPGAGVGSRRVLRRGSRLVTAAVLGSYGWIILGLGWAEVVRGAWGLRDAILVDELLILAPFLALQLAAWVGLAPGERAARRAARGASAGSTSLAWAVVTRARQSLGMVLPATFLFATGQDLARWAWPARAADPGFQFGMMIALGGAVLVLAPAFVRLSWPTRSLPAGPLRDRLERVAARFRFRCTDILLWDTDGTVVNAGVTGAFPYFRYVLLTDALIAHLNDHEVAAVFGHEVGHARHRHLAFFGLFFVGSVGVVTLFGASVGEPALRALLPADLAPTWQAAAQGGVVLAGALAYFGVVFGHLSRRFERQADVFGARAVSCDRVECPPHPDPYAHRTPAELAKLDERAPICPVGLRTFINALRAVAVLNGIDPKARSWRHGSIARRVAFLEQLEDRPDAERRFQAGINRLRVIVAVVLAAALALAFETGAMAQLGS